MNCQTPARKFFLCSTQQQVRTLFSKPYSLTGIILTKLDGTAKGGIVLAIKNDYDIPVKFIGVGEKIDDIEPFDPVEFVNAIIDPENEEPVDEIVE